MDEEWKYTLFKLFQSIEETCIITKQMLKELEDKFDEIIDSYTTTKIIMKLAEVFDDKHGGKIGNEKSKLMDNYIKSCNCIDTTLKDIIFGNIILIKNIDNCFDDTFSSELTDRASNYKQNLSMYINRAIELRNNIKNIIQDINS